MKISLATNFDNKLIDEIKRYPVYEVYGKLKEDIIGGGRPYNLLKNLNKATFEEHVKKVRAAGINFNYLLNGACLSNFEQSSKWQQEVIEFLNYLKDVGVNALTVTNPHLLILIKKNYDCFVVRISTFANIDSIFKAKYWEDLGADILCLDFRINRDFKLLKEIQENLVTTKIELLATNSCLKDCPIMNTHTNSLAHASNIIDNDYKYEDWCLHNCQSYQLNHLEEYIKSPWIRPEDIKYYEEIGIEYFKITERDFPTKELVKRMKAYYYGKYDNNLIDLVQGHGWSSAKKENLSFKNHFNNRQEVLNEIKKIRGLGCERKYPRHIYIDNKKLDNFIKFFIDGNCKNNCSKCNYCEMIANKVIIENEEILSYLKKLYTLYEDLKFTKE